MTKAGWGFKPDLLPVLLSVKLLVHYIDHTDYHHFFLPRYLTNVFFFKAKRIKEFKHIAGKHAYVLLIS